MIEVHEQFDVPASPERVWAVLSDPHAVVGCVPGASIVGQEEDGTLDTSVAVKFGPTRVTFRAKALLDLDEPWRVLYRTEPYLMSPQALYECVGDVPNVVFPCAALTDAPTGRIAIYYGCADTVTGLAFCQVDELIAFIKANSRV